MKRLIVFGLHLGYWFLYGLLLFVIMTVMQQGRGGHAIPTGGLRNFFLLFTCAPAVLGFYLFYSWLFPRFLQKKKYGLLMLLAPVSALVASLISGLLMSMYMGRHIMFADGWQSYIEETIALAIIAIIHGTVALVLRGFVSWTEESRLRQALAQKNFDTELALVKAQINPHFLFNTLNNIDVLIEQNSAKASQYLNKLSDILRFMLFETKPEHIPLRQELTYLEKYVDLQKIRAQHPDYVRLEINGSSEAQIPPMLFIPFVENAFTYSEAFKSEPAVQISFTLTKGKIDFVCENKYRPATSENGSGLGLALIEKRLNLLYPGRHTLKIAQDAQSYRVHLSLQTA